ncbi:hypothetical protein GS475_02695 [Rhodococcus hoagii]|nr:hypothetical protein [Prescottella equi]
MSYSKFREKWFPRPDPRTPVTPEAIEHIEDGVKRAHDAIDALGDIGDNLANLVTKEEANATYAPAGAVARKRGPILDDQPARRLLFDALAEINSRPLIIPWLTASTGEGSVADNDKTMHVLLQKMLQATYNPPGITGGYSLKVRAWTKTGSTGEVLDSDTKKLAVLNTGGTAKHTSFGPSTGIEIHYPCGPGLGSWTLSIDGQVVTTIDPDSAASYTGIFRSDRVDPKVRDYQFTALEDNAQLGLAYIRNLDERAGIRLYNFGRAGGATAQFLNAEADSTWERINSLVPDGAMLMLGHNDMGNGVSTAQLKTNLGLIVDRVQSAAKRPVWVGVLVQHSTDARWPAYADAIEEFCATRPDVVTCHSFREYFADNVADAAASGEYFTDNLHLNNKGHRKAGYVIGDGLRLSSNTWPAIPATAALPSVNPTVRTSRPS